MQKEKLVDLILNDYASFEKIHAENPNIEITEADFSHSSIENADFSEIDFSTSARSFRNKFKTEWSWYCFFKRSITSSANLIRF